MINHWEVFEDGPTVPLEERIHVTLNYKNVIHINAQLHERLGRPEAAVLMFDKVNSIIGINPAPATLPNAFRLQERPRGRHRLIHAAPFCRRYGIKIDNTTQFINPEIDDDGVLRLDLRATMPVKKRPYKRNKR